MQEFRPATLVDADTELAQRFQAGERDAIIEVVERYGAALSASIAGSVGGDVVEATADVFATGLTKPIDAGADFAPWFATIAADQVGEVDEQLFSIVRATQAVDSDVRDGLRGMHVDGASLDDDSVARHELRLQRRLAHLGDESAIRDALAAPEAWRELDPDLVDSVLQRAGHVSTTEAARVQEAAQGVNRPVGSTTARLLRPALLGITGALVMLIAVVTILSAVGGAPATPTVSLDLVPTGEFVEVDGGTVEFTERDAGLEITLDAITLPRRAGGTFYEGVLVLADGAELSAGTFAEGVDVTLWGGADLGDVVEFRIEARAADDPAGDTILSVDVPRT